MKYQWVARVGMDFYALLAYHIILWFVDWEKMIQKFKAK